MSCYLPDDLISEIFERLPPKSLIRFRSLSKSWFSRISSRKFVHRHLLQSRRKIIVRHFNANENEDIYTLNWHRDLPCPRIGDMDITSLKFPVGPDCPCEVIGLSNGMICLFDIVDEQVCFYLWNFSVRRKLSLAYHPLLTDSILEGRHEALGFGFDQVNDDYKIVCISYSKYGPAEKTIVYSMKTDTWSEIASPSSSYLEVKYDRPVFYNGVLHWLVKYNLNDHMVMTFDLSSHVFGSISLPEPSWEPVRLSTIGNILYVMSIGDDKIWTWKMSEYNNVASWSLYSKFDIGESDSESSREEEGCSCEISGYVYVESLQLLDRGTACGETFTPMKNDVT